MAIGSRNVFKQGLTLLLPILLWIFAASVQGSPIDTSLNNLAERSASDESLNNFVERSPIEDSLNDLEKRKPAFPTLDDCRAKIKAPAADTSLFFTGLGKKDVNKAKKYADDHKLSQVSGVYPTGFTNVGQYDGSDDKTKVRAFQEAFSQAYAEATSGIAYLMLDDGKEPKDDSIFNSVEFKAMKDGGKVTKILRFSFSHPPDDPTKATEVFWQK